jgi:DNA polymerase-3 subunit chi
MTRIDFYTLKPGTRGDRFDFTCRLLERIRAGGLRVLIHCPDPQQARHLDRLLWTYREDSFLPHGRLGETDPELTPILISADGRPESEQQVLINLDGSPEPPPFYSRFERICEPVDHDPALRQAGRRRFLYYRERGHAPAHHEV